MKYGFVGYYRVFILNRTHQTVAEKERKGSVKDEDPIQRNGTIDTAVGRSHKNCGAKLWILCLELVKVSCFFQNIFAVRILVKLHFSNQIEWNGGCEHMH